MTGAPQMSDAGLSALSVLVVDDEADIRLGLKRLLAAVGIEAAEAPSGEVALDRFTRAPADLVITDLMMPGLSGVELLGEIRRRKPDCVVMVLTGFGTVHAAVQCLQAGAAHFLCKPFENEEILGFVRRAGRQILARRAAAKPDGVVPIVAEDPRMLRVLELVRQVAPSPVSVLIEGESGTGKELVARALHAGSPASGRPFQAVNCAALSDTLLESELFGHRRGAFTGAAHDRRGLFEAARGGTVFLDEIASMSPAFQGKLLRVLQERAVRPVGADIEVPVEFRLVAACNRDLAALVRAGGFREDLYFRLAVVRVVVPPLRERPGDLLPLARVLLERAAAECRPDGESPVLEPDALAALAAHRWPGNVRELENALRRAVVVCHGSRIRSHHLALDEAGLTGPLGFAPEGSGGESGYAEAKRQVVEAFQREYLQRALERSAGNVSRAAEACGLTRVAMQKLMRQLGLERADFAREPGGGPG